MKKRTIILLIWLTILSGAFVYCTITEKVIDETKKIVDKGVGISKDALEKAKEMITGDKSSGKVIEKYNDNKKVSDYNLENFKSDIEAKDYKVEIISKDKDFFDAPKFEVKIGEDKVSAYDYEEIITLDKDLSDISENGLVVGGTKISWIKAPHYYKKGELLIIYDGDSKKIITSLDEIFKSELFK